ncbi:MAG: RICIN domain-containing protein, partial [Coriobacteriia bacterium]|nr:RICIN domain-containing protein [Coriobacteriia bacterium]
MERSAVKYPWLAVIVLALAAALAAPCLAFADEATDTLPTNEGDSSLVIENDAAEGEDAAAVGNEIVLGDESESTQAVEPVVAENGAGEPATTPEPEAETVATEPAEEFIEDPVATPVEETVDPVEEEPVADEAQETDAVTAAAEAAAPVVTATAAKAPTKKAATAKTTAKKASAKKASGKTLANGWYFIESAKKLYLVLGIDTDSGNAAAQKDKNKAYQRWYLKYISSKGGYYIRNGKTDKYLSVDGAKKQGASVIQLTKKAGGKGAVWTIKETSAGGYIIKSLLGNVILDINGGKKVKDGANVDIRKKVVSSGKVAPYQRWYFLPEEPDVDPSNVTIANGVYKVNLATSSKSQVLNVAGASMENKGNVASATSSIAQSQKWGISNAGGGFYYIVNVNSGKALTVEDGKKTATANISQYKLTSKGKNGGNAQKWAIHKNSDGTVSFINKETGMALQLTKDASGANARTYFANNTAKEKFELTKTAIIGSDKDIYSIAFSKKTSNVLTVPKNSLDSGEQLESSTYKKGLNQKFEIVKVGDNMYTIQSAVSGKFLSTIGNELVQAGKSGSDWQKWTPVWRTTGIQFVNVASGLAMTITDGSTKDGANAIVSSKSSSTAQRFVIQSRDLIDKGYYYLHIASPDKDANVIGIKEGSKDAGAKANINKVKSNNALKFKVIPLGNDTYRFKNVNSKKVLTVSGSSIVQKKDSSNASKWKATISPNGGLVLKNVSTGKAMNASSKVRSAVKQAAVNPTSATQRWYPEVTNILKKYQQLALDRVIQRGSKTNYYFVV